MTAGQPHYAQYSNSADSRKGSRLRHLRHQCTGSGIARDHSVLPSGHQIGYLSLFKDLGVGIIQMAYNTQNLVATGCYESKDAGLSDFGREVVAEMNRLGTLCDLSHVGPQSSRNVIRASRQPAAYSHCMPAGLKSHPRNRSDEELRFIIDHGGFVGVTMFTPFLARGTDATIDDYLEAIEYVINLCGEERVGYGTDFTQGHDQDFFDWISHDKATRAA